MALLRGLVLTAACASSPQPAGVPPAPAAGAADVDDQAMRLYWGPYEIRVAPPMITGERMNLQFEQGLLRGMIGGQSVHIKVEAEKAYGTFARRSVELEIESAPGEVVLSGSWAEGPVELTATNNYLRGRVHIMSYRNTRAMRAPIAERWTKTIDLYQARDSALPAHAVYHWTQDGRRWLALPRAMESWLEPRELAVFLLVLMTV